ncbi:MAG TPA: hypothetical protein VHK65_17695 [Candidatus Dormibacteraeota bacterium]|nr:hypothetical protein [Candidatus Dormibacteraeota bacterium]
MVPGGKQEAGSLRVERGRRPLIEEGIERHAGAAVEDQRVEGENRRNDDGGARGAP